MVLNKTHGNTVLSHCQCEIAVKNNMKKQLSLSASAVIAKIDVIFILK